MRIQTHTYSHARIREKNGHSNVPRYTIHTSNIAMCHTYIVILTLHVLYANTHAYRWAAGQPVDCRLRLSKRSDFPRVPNGSFPTNDGGTTKGARPIELEEGRGTTHASDLVLAGQEHVACDRIHAHDALCGAIVEFLLAACALICVRSTGRLPAKALLMPQLPALET